MQTEKDLIKLTGPGLLVCARTSEAAPDKMHLVAGEGGRLQLAAGVRCFWTHHLQAPLHRACCNCEKVVHLVVGSLAESLPILISLPVMCSSASAALLCPAPFSYAAPHESTSWRAISKGSGTCWHAWR